MNEIDMKLMIEAINRNTAAMASVESKISDLLTTLASVCVEDIAPDKSPNPAPEVELTLDDIRLKPEDIGKLCVGAVEAGVDKQAIKEKIRELGADQVKGLGQDGLKAMMIFLTEEVNKSNQKVASS